MSFATLEMLLAFNPFNSFLGNHSANFANTTNIYSTQSQKIKVGEQKIINAGVGFNLNFLTSEFENTGYQDLERRIGDTWKYALKTKGDVLGAYHLPAFEINGNPRLNVRFEYLHGPRGGSGAIRVLIYLDKDSWYKNIGINDLKLFFFSLDRTTMSKKIYEVNVNKYLKKVTFMPLEYRILETDYLSKKFESSFYNVLKKAKIKKKDINNILFIKEALKDLSDYQLRQEIISEGNKIVQDHVWYTEFDYKGYGFFDVNEKLRAPKLLEFVIERGEESVLGFGIIARVRDYKNVNALHMNIGKKKIISEEEGIYAHMPIKRFIGKSRKYSSPNNFSGSNINKTTNGE